MLNTARFAKKKCGAPFVVYVTFFIFVTTNIGFGSA